MDSSSKPETSAESSSTIPTKTVEKEPKDSQSKPNPTQFLLSSQTTSVVGASAGTAPSTTENTKSTTQPVSTSTTTASPSTTSSTPHSHSVTISLGVGALQVGKSSARIPTPPKPTVSSVSQDVTPTSSLSGASTLVSIAGFNKDSIKTVTSHLNTSTSYTQSTTSSSSSELILSHSGSDNLKPAIATTTSSPNQLPTSIPTNTPPVVSEASSTGGALTTVSSSTTTAMKRPTSEISGPTSNSATTESTESDAGTEHRRKKMRKDNKNDRSDSPGSTPSGSQTSINRSIRNVGNKQGSPSGSGNVGEFSGKGSVFSAKPSDTSTAAQEKSDEKKNFEGSVSSSSIGSGNTGNTSGSHSSSHGLSTANGSGGPKVPPLKIVLQSHSHSTVTTTSTTGATPSISTTFKSSNATEESSQSSSYGSGSTSGFPYVVSSTTDANPSGGNVTDSGHTSETAAASKSNLHAQSAAPEQKDATETANESQSQSKLSSGSLLSNISTDASHSATPNTTNALHSAGTTSVTTSSASAPAKMTAMAGGSVDKSKDLSGSLNETLTTGDGGHEKTKPDEETKKETGTSQRDGGTAVTTTPASNNSSHISTPAPNAEHEKEKEIVKEKESVKEPGTVPKEKEKPVRVTRSSQRILKEGVGSHTPNSPSSSSPKTSACPSPSYNHQTDSQGSVEAGTLAKQGPSDGTEKMDTSEPVELHPRKRKIKTKDVPAASSVTASTSSSTATAEPTEQQQAAANAANDQPMLNCFEMYLNIRKQIDRRRRNLFPVTPKPPKGYKDYFLNRGTYILAGNSNALAVPLNTASSTLPQQMKDYFTEQEKDRHKLRLQHVVEKEKLVLSVEQEILRVHGRAARALSNQTLPFSVCTILKDQEVYNLLTPEQEEKDINARSRYNGRLFLSWLQDVDDKWDKIKEYMLLRHHNEAESLHAVQKMDWEWKLKEFGLCEPKATPVIDDLSVPMVHVSDDFDLLPA